eukprot:850615-Alexandrium_andersonii.AAC.1
MRRRLACTLARASLPEGGRSRTGKRKACRRLRAGRSRGERNARGLPLAGGCAGRPRGSRR